MISPQGEGVTLTIDRNEAAQALSEIDQIATRVRQSRLYNQASLMLTLWGGLVFTAYLVAMVMPRQAGWIWIGTNLTGVIGSIGISLFIHEKSGVRTFDWRAVAALALLFGFGVFWSVGIAHLPPRELNAFWATYFMLFYSMAGLWLGLGFLVIGVGIAVLTLIGYFFVGPHFELWMAFVNGGGLVLGGFWMRRN